MKPTGYLPFLAKSYLHASDAPRPIRYILRLCYIGITIGALSLMLSLIIMRGFEREVSAKMKGINADITITGYGQQLDMPSLKKHINTVMGPFITGMSGSSTRYLLLHRNNQTEMLFMRGIVPADEARTTSLPTKIIHPKTTSLPHLLGKHNSIIIGAQLAQKHRLDCGDTVTAYAPHEGAGSYLNLEKHTLTVAGIFRIGLEEYDTNVAYCNQETMRTLCPDCTGVDQIVATIAPPPSPPTNAPWQQRLRAWWSRTTTSTAEHAARQLLKLKLLLTGLSVRGWHELYPDLVSSLNLEKYMMTIVLGLIALVASMLMICLLFMFIQYKQRDIALLRALGARQEDIYCLFRRIGMTIVMRATLTGLALAGSIGWWIDAYKPIQLPDAYYISYLPAALEPISFIVIFVVSLLLGYLACLIPLRQLRTVSITNTLRQSS